MMPLRNITSIILAGMALSWGEEPNSVSSESKDSLELIGLPLTAVSSISAESQHLVVLGLEKLMTHDHLSSYRDFMRAAEIDPQCLMAHWGVAMSLLSQGEDKKDLRIQSLKHLQSFLQEQDDLPEREQSYAQFALSLSIHGKKEAFNLLLEMRQRWPRDPVLALMENSLQHDFREQVDHHILLKLLEEQPQLYVAHFLEASRTSTKQSNDELKSSFEHAQRCVELRPDYYQSHYIQGICQFYLGRYQAAVIDFDQAIKLMKEKIDAQIWSKGDAQDLILAHIYLAQAYHLDNKTEKAYRVCDQLAQLPFEAKEEGLYGSLAHHWIGSDLKLKLFLSQWTVISSKSWTKISQNVAKDLKVKNPDLWDLHNHFAQGKMACQAKNDTLAQKSYNALQLKLGQLLDKLSFESNPITKGYIQQASQLAIVYMMRIQSMRFPSTQYVWLKNACDAQQGALFLEPPMLPYPQEFLLAKAFLSKREKEQAKEALQEGLRKFPNNPFCIELLTQLNQQEK